MVDEYVLDRGYVFKDDGRGGYYYTANRGIFRTKGKAQRECDRHNRIYGENCKVCRVDLVVREE